MIAAINDFRSLTGEFPDNDMSPNTNDNVVVNGRIRVIYNEMNKDDHFLFYLRVKNSTTIIQSCFAINFARGP